MRSSPVPAPPAPPTELPPTRATEGLGPPGSGDSPGFASVLHQARTAVAEGQPRTATENGGHRLSRADSHASSRGRVRAHGGGSASIRAAHTPTAHVGDQAMSTPTTPAAQPQAQTAAQQDAPQQAAPQQDRPQQDAQQQDAQQQDAQQQDASQQPTAAQAAAEATTPQQTAAAPVVQAQAIQAVVAASAVQQPSTQPPATEPPQQQQPDPTQTQSLAPVQQQPPATQPQQPAAGQPQLQPAQQQPAPPQSTGAQAAQPAQPGQPAQPIHASATAVPAADPSKPATDHQQDTDQQNNERPQPQDVRSGLQSILTQPGDATAGTAPPTTPNLHVAPAAPSTPAPQPAAQPNAQAAPQAAPALNLSSTTSATPTSASTPAQATATRYAVPLERTIETVRMTIEAGARQGFSQARIQLSPASLGEVRINLQRTADGVVAKVVTEHQAAAQTLTQGGAELRRSLEAAGVNLVRLDIEARADSGATSRDPSRSTSPGHGRRPHDDPTDNSDEPGRSEHTLVLPSGALVNVLA